MVGSTWESSGKFGEDVEAMGRTITAFVLNKYK